MRRPQRDAARHLRRAVNRLPQRTKEAMLRGLERNRIIVGAYVDPDSGGICPMLAAHRNGGRTSVASFARAWDAYTGAKRPRRATRREVHALRSMLEQSLELDPAIEHTPIAELAAQIRAERAALAGRCETPEPETPKAKPGRHGPGPFLDLLSVAEQALAEDGSWERSGEPEPAER